MALPRTSDLEAVPLFSASTPRELMRIGHLVEEVEFHEHEPILREGEHGSEVYVLVDGTASVDISGRYIATVGPGELVGEMAAVTGAPRTASVVARSRVKALALSRDALAIIFDECPSVARRMLRIIVRRLRAAQNVRAGDGF